MELLNMIGHAKRTTEDLVPMFTFEEIKEAQVVAFEGGYQLAWFALDALRMAKKADRAWRYTDDSKPMPLQECDISYMHLGTEPSTDTGCMRRDGSWIFTGGQELAVPPYAWRPRDDEPAPVRP